MLGRESGRWGRNQFFGLQICSPRWKSVRFVGSQFSGCEIRVLMKKSVLGWKSVLSIRNQFAGLKISLLREKLGLWVANQFSTFEISSVGSKSVFYVGNQYFR